MENFRLDLDRALAADGIFVEQDGRGCPGEPGAGEVLKLRLKERRIYDLVRQRAIPHVRATGKLLFPRAQVDAWIAAKGEAPVRAERARPPIIAGSHDPLLEWSVRESRSRPRTRVNTVIGGRSYLAA